MYTAVTQTTEPLKTTDAAKHARRNNAASTYIQTTKLRGETAMKESERLLAEQLEKAALQDTTKHARRNAALRFEQDFPDAAQYDEGGTGNYEECAHEEFPVHLEATNKKAPERTSSTGPAIATTLHPKNDGGSTPHQYGLPSGATELQDLIEYRGMNFAQGNIFKAQYRSGNCSHSDALRDARKTLWFAQREVERLSNGK